MAHPDSSTCSVHDGAVISDSNGVINLAAEGLDAASQRIMGPLIAFGRNRWPWADSVHMATLAGQINNLANYYTPFWRTAMPGTVSVKNGSSTITGSGTNFLLPCGGSGRTPLYGAVFILHYPGLDLRDHYTVWNIVSCDGPTSITVSGDTYNGWPTVPNYPWPNRPNGCTGSTWNWGYNGASPESNAPHNQWGSWTYGVAPGNYYDNTKSFYAMYWRSGIDTYLTAAHTLADSWWELPKLDQGYGCYSGAASRFEQNNNTCFAVAAWRSMALAGVVLRALEEGPGSPKWPGLRVIWQLANWWETLRTGDQGVDQRENGYAIGILGLCAITDPDATQSNTCKASLVSILPKWTAAKRADLGGSWGSLYPLNPYTSISENGGGGTVCVSHNSTSVTGSGLSPDWSAINGQGTGWSLGTFSNLRGRSLNHPAYHAAGDSQTYAFTVTSPTSMTITPAYQGATACGRGYLIGYPQGGGSTAATAGFVGWGIQPYALGILGEGFFLAGDAISTYDPANAAIYKQHGDAIVQWLISKGSNPAYGGFYNGTYVVGCTPPVSPTNIACYCGGCSSVADSGTRLGPLEASRAFSEDYLVFGSAATKTAMDAFFDEMFSKPGTGGPNADGYYLNQYDPGGLFVSGVPPAGTAPKWTGQACGYTEGCDMWPAVRFAAGAGPKPNISSGVSGGVGWSGRVSF